MPQAIYSFNLPYSVAVHTAGSETNLLKLGSQQGTCLYIFIYVHVYYGLVFSLCVHLDMLPRYNAIDIRVSCAS